MSRVITLTTDFGHKGPFVGVMKGVILSRAPDARIIDLTHEIFVHWSAEAGFWLSRSYHYFPAGSVHVAVVDPGVGMPRNILAAVFDGHVFLAPDNGLLPQILNGHGKAEVFRMSESWRAKQDWPTPSSTFHGRDIFAPLAADILNDRISPADIGPVTTDLVPSLMDEPVTVNGQVRGSVIAIDHFGNLITNIDKSLVTIFEHPQVNAAGHHLALQQTYGHTVPGNYLALINSFGVVEVARAEGSAAEGLGLGHGAPVVISEK